MLIEYELESRTKGQVQFVVFLLCLILLHLCFHQEACFDQTLFFPEKVL